MALTDNLKAYSPRAYPKLGNVERYTNDELSRISTALNTIRSVLQTLEGNTLTVATLPAAASYKGAQYMVSDANATTFWSIVAGGGTNLVPVRSDGTNWRIG